MRVLAWPNVGVPRVKLYPVNCRLAMLKALNTSPATVSVARSLYVNFLLRRKSVSKNGSPTDSATATLYFEAEAIEVSSRRHCQLDRHNQTRTRLIGWVSEREHECGVDRSS